MLVIFHFLLVSAFACDDYKFVSDLKPYKAIQFLNERCIDTILLGPAIFGITSKNFDYPQKKVVQVTYKKRGTYSPDIFTYFDDGNYTPNARRIYFETYGAASHLLKKSIELQHHKNTVEPGDLIQKDGEEFEVMSLYVNYQKIVLAFLYSHQHHFGSFQRISRWTHYLLLGERPN